MNLLQPRKPLDIELTSNQIIALRFAGKFSAEPWGAGATTGRALRRRVAIALAAKGLVISNGFHPQADGDGFLRRPERFVEAWAITKKGAKWLRIFDAPRGAR